MHVLGMPPAFVLSQDQTLRLTRTIQQPGSHPAARQSKPTKILTKRAFVRQSTSPDARPRLSPKTPLPEHAKNPTKNTSDEAKGSHPMPPPTHPFLQSNNVKQRRSSGASARPRATRRRFGHGKPRSIAMSGRCFKPLKAFGTGDPEGRRRHGRRRRRPRHGP